MAESTTVTLPELLNDGFVQNVTREWKDVGLELDIPQHKLEEIQCDHSGSVSDRKREMFQYWLNNNENPTLEEVHKVIQTVCERRTREETRNQAEGEREEVEGAVGQLEKFIGKFKQRNDKIVSDVEKYEAELGREKEWMRKSSTDKNVWQNEELAATKRDIEKALCATNLRENQFAKDYLAREYDQDASQLTEKEVEGYLRQALVGIESQKSRSVRDHCKHAKKHFKKQTHLQNEIDESKRVLDGRLIAYDNIRERLLKLGVRANAEILIRLNEQKKSVEAIQRECTTMHDECREVLEYATDNLQECKRELEVLMHSLSDNLTKLENVFKAISVTLKVVYNIIVVGACTIYGAAFGTAVLPIVGTVIGAYVGNTIGRRVLGETTEAKARREHERLSRSQTNFNEQLMRGQNERNAIQSLLRD